MAWMQFSTSRYTFSRSLAQNELTSIPSGLFEDLLNIDSLWVTVALYHFTSVWWKKIIIQKPLPKQAGELFKQHFWWPRQRGGAVCPLWHDATFIYRDELRKMHINSSCCHECKPTAAGFMKISLRRCPMASSTRRPTWPLCLSQWYYDFNLDDFIYFKFRLLNNNFLTSIPSNAFANTPFLSSLLVKCFDWRLTKIIVFYFSDCSANKLSSINITFPNTLQAL